MSQAAIDDVGARLAREGIYVDAVQYGEGVRVKVLSSAWSAPHTWLRIFMEFAGSGYGVKVE